VVSVRAFRWIAETAQSSGYVRSTESTAATSTSFRLQICEKKYKNLRAGTAGVTGLQLEQRKQEGDE